LFSILPYFFLFPSSLNSINVFIELGFLNSSGRTAFIIAVLESSIGADGVAALITACIVSVSLL